MLQTINLNDKSRRFSIEYILVCGTFFFAFGITTRLRTIVGIVETWKFSREIT